MTYHIYVLKSSLDGKFYVGMTTGLKRRMKPHASGQVVSTRFRRPFQLIYTEKVEDRKMGRARELYWKSGTGREKKLFPH